MALQPWSASGLPGGPPQGDQYELDEGNSIAQISTKIPQPTPYPSYPNNATSTSIVISHHQPPRATKPTPPDNAKLSSSSPSNPVPIGAHAHAQHSPQPPSTSRARLVDPRLRAVLAVQPEHDPHLMRIPAAHAAAAATHHPSHPAAAIPPQHQHPVQPTLSPPALDKPTLSSTLALEKQINHLAHAKFNTVAAMANLLHTDKDGVVRVHQRITTKALNVARKSALYKGLPPLASNSHVPPVHPVAHPFTHLDADAAAAAGGMIGSHPAHHPLPSPILSKAGPYVSGPNGIKMIPRARKSVNKIWLDSLDLKPDFLNDARPNMEVDTIALPYPQITDDPRSPAATSGPHLALSSFSSHMEDWNRYVAYQQPVKWQEMVPQ
ncbi:hypothetical protein SeMB42_g01211 [Synchytrium endobioticum]|uniref:Protein phosphatase 1 regulatory subunit 35 C-terminal domain-containing protein n=1 Tax=Synchytrium endobioticum TaxID=286115 RepID=A0A507DM45_9FUNG|nr:hypothetical protein SeMB42_g01211 [Synchytrium endobioticum]